LVIVVSVTGASGAFFLMLSMMLAAERLSL
jgi:hypothetical protein